MRLKKIVKHHSLNLPSQRELKQLLRTQFNTNIWRNYDLNCPTPLIPENNSCISTYKQYSDLCCEVTVPLTIYELS